MRHSLGNALWGIFFIALGVGFGGQVMGYWHFSLFFNGWWTLVIIVPSIISIVQNGFRTGNCIVLAIGVLLLLGEQDFISGHLIGELIFPLILVVIGISIIFRGKGSRRAREVKLLTQGETQDYTAIFGSQELRFPGESFRGATLTAVFGGIELDLRDALITEDITITTTSIFGGIDINVPPNVRVDVSSTPIFGGVSDKTPRPTDINPPTVYLNSVCIFGGVDIL